MSEWVFTEKYAKRKTIVSHIHFTNNLNYINQINTLQYNKVSFFALMPNICGLKAQENVNLCTSLNLPNLR